MIQIPNFEGYCVGEDGSVIGPSGKTLKAQPTDKGYLRVFLGYGKAKRVHRLVATAYVDNPYGHSEVNHKDGDKTNNSASNLEWVSHKENMNHAYANGLLDNPFGEKSRRSILTQEQVEYVRSVYVPKHKEFGQTALGKLFGVTNSCIWRIVHGDNWSAS